MIEKLNIDPTQSVATNHCIINKINELVDAVNAIQKEREAEWFEIKEWIGILEAVRKSVNVHEKQIDELQMKLEPEKCEPKENTQDENLKCPFCQQELEKYYWDDLECYACPDLTCKGYFMTATKDMWQELIRTRKALDVAVDALKQIKDGKIPVSLGIYMDINDALEQITALEQKDVK